MNHQGRIILAQAECLPAKAGLRLTPCWARLVTGPADSALTLTGARALAYVSPLSLISLMPRIKVYPHIGEDINLCGFASCFFSLQAVPLIGSDSGTFYSSLSMMVSNKVWLMMIMSCLLCNRDQMVDDTGHVTEANTFYSFLS
jgi:hypothetical protein